MVGGGAPYPASIEKESPHLHESKLKLTGCRVLFRIKGPVQGAARAPVETSRGPKKERNFPQDGTGEGGGKKSFDQSGLGTRESPTSAPFGDRERENLR